MRVEDLGPGQRMNALVAHHIFNWQYGDQHYSTDILAAWEVVEALRGRAYHLQLALAPGLNAVTIAAAGLEHACQRRGQTMPHAICIAALLAAGVTEVPDE